MSERLLDLVHRRLDALAALVDELKQQPPGHEGLPAAVEAVADRLAQIEVRAAELSRNQAAEVAVAADRVIAALRANEAILRNSITDAIQQLTPNLDRIEAGLGETAGEQQTQMSNLRNQLQSLESRLEALAAKLEQRRLATPQLPDYGRLAVTDAIPIPPSAQTPDSNV
jgi:predicted  nucleic acid-binding Zn-ribbon protein